MCKVEYLPAALRDMTQIVRYISGQLCNPTAAQALSEEFVAAAERLAAFPYSCGVYVPIRPLEKEYRRCVVRNYLLFYTVDEVRKTVTVCRVIYAKRNMNNLL